MCTIATFEVDPRILELDDPRIEVLRTGSIPIDKIEELIHADDPFELKNGYLHFLDETEIERRKREFLIHALLHFKMTGGISPTILWNNRKTLIEVFPEFTNIIESIEKELGVTSCNSCTFQKRVMPFITQDLLRFKYDGRDLNPLKSFIGELGIRKLKGEIVNIDPNSIPIPPQFQKKKIPKKSEFMTLEDKFNIKCDKCGCNKMIIQLIDDRKTLVIECSNCKNSHLMRL